jgi:endoglycosylceramidase
MRKYYLALIVLLGCVSSGIAEQIWPPDPQGRHVIVHGVVTLTGDGTSEYNYSLVEYRRMIPLGINLQVIRLFAGQMGAWPGYSLTKDYLEKLDRMVGWGKQVGVLTVFKMTVYDIKGSESPRFGPQDWTDFWLNKDGRKDMFVEAWRKLFEHFRNEPAVVGYDLLNECSKGRLEVDDAAFVTRYLFPYYRQTIDVLRKISPAKWAWCQPPIGAPPVSGAIDRPGVVFAPHMYADVREYFATSGRTDPTKYPPVMDRLQDEATSLHTPIVIGEYGNPAIIANDGDREKQFLHQEGDIGAVTEFDRRAIGSVKTWFCGSRHTIKYLGPELTWGIFFGDSDAGGPERKYIVDIFARPIPLVIAGHIETFNFNFATRQFEMKLTAGVAQGESEIFVPRERHFPDGFRLIQSNGVALAYDPASPSGLRVVSNPNRLDISAYRWDEARNRIVVRRWAAEPGPMVLKIVPGARD